MSKKTSLIYIVLFAICFAAPVLFFRLGGSRLVDSANYENRILAERPALPKSYAEYLDFPGQFESYFDDHLPFRNQLVTAAGYADYEFFRDTASDSVIIGKDGWLFYKGSQVNGEDPIADYEGTNLYSEEELQQIADNMKAMQQQAYAEGVSKFAIMVCPNKENIYSEYMPDAYGSRAESTRMEQVVKYLRENTDLLVVDASEPITEYKAAHPDTQLYFKYDTHWNNRGAFLGAYALNTAIGVSDIPGLDVLSEDAGAIPGYDLARLLHLGNILTDDGNPQLYGYTLHTIQSEHNTDNTMFRYWNEANDGDPRTVMMIGDSFSSLMSKYVGCNFSNMFVTFYYNYTHDDLEREHPDVLVYEVVERYINNMKEFNLNDGLKAVATD